MPGFMKKTAVYLGLMEGDDPYAYEDYSEDTDEEARVVHQDDHADDETERERFAAPRESPEEHDSRPLFLSEPRRPQTGERGASVEPRGAGEYARPALSMLPERTERYERPAQVATAMSSIPHGFGGGSGGGAASEAYRITTLHPRSYNEGARTIGEHFRDGTPVIMNLSEMDDADQKRAVDFAAGLIFGLRGTMERVTRNVFLLSPANVDVTAEDKARIAEGGFFNQS
jgi:cell division inhibitor SepF